MASRLHRLIRIIRIVRAKHFPTVQDLCDTLQIKERTLFSDLKEIKEDLGVEIKFDRTRGGYYVLSNDVEMNFMTLSEESALLLLAAFGLLQCHGGDELVRPLLSVFEDEIDLALGSAGHGNARKQVIRFGNCGDGIEANKDVFVSLCRACFSESKVKVLVSNGNGMEEMLIKPSHLVYSPEHWKLAFQNNNGDQLEELDFSSIKSIEDVNSDQAQ